MKRKYAIALVVLVVAVVASAIGFSNFFTQQPPRCEAKAFGTNLGFETGNFEGWAGPIGIWDITSNITHSGKYSAYAETSSKFSAEIYQNWPVNPSCEVYLEAYVYVACGIQGFNIMGIQLREIDSVGLVVSVCPNPGSYPTEKDSIQVNFWHGYRPSSTTGRWFPYSFKHNEWYKLGLTFLQENGMVRFHVNDQAVYAEKQFLNFTKPSFGATVEVWSSTYFDDFSMGQRNPTSSSLDHSPVSIIGGIILIDDSSTSRVSKSRGSCLLKARQVFSYFS